MSKLVMLLLMQNAVSKEVDNGCLVADAVNTGDTALCSGIVIPRSWAIDAAKIKMVDLPRCSVELGRVTQLLDLEKATRKEETVVFDDYKARTDKLIEDMSAPPTFFEKPTFWAGAGLVVGTATTVAIVYAVGGGR